MPDVWAKARPEAIRAAVSAASRTTGAAAERLKAFLGKREPEWW